MSFRFGGLEQMKVDLLNLPAELQAAAGQIVRTHGDRAVARITAIYRQHVVTGELAGKTSVRYDFQTGKAASAIIKNTSPLAYIFENGTQARHYVTVNGKQHLTGRMPGFHTFIPIVAQERRAMQFDMKPLLVEKGLSVHGDA